MATPSPGPRLPRCAGPHYELEENSDDAVDVSATTAAWARANTKSAGLATGDQ